MIFECLYVILQFEQPAPERKFLYVCARNSGDSVGTATRPRCERSGVQGSSSSGGKRFSSPKRKDRLWGPQSLLFNGQRGSFSGVNRPGRGVNQASPSSAQHKNDWSYTSTPLCAFKACTGKNSPTLSVLPKLWKATISFVMSVCSSARMEQLGSNWTDFYEIWYLGVFFFRKSIQII
jgi:hypothetical protein